MRRPGLLGLVGMALLVSGGLGFANGEPITLFAQPTVVSDAALLSGSIESGQGGESVTIQAKDCGQDDFAVVAGTTTTSGGGWTTAYYPLISTTVRAVWNGHTSAQLQLRQRAIVELGKLKARNAFVVGVRAKKSFWRKHVLIQRREHGAWTTVKNVVLTEAGSPPGSSISEAGAEFKLSVPKGTLLRAVVPQSQARPCYLAGTSRVLRR